MNLQRALRTSVKRDRAAWLDKLAASGDWQLLKQLRRGSKPTQGRLRDRTGTAVASNQKAETLADYLEQVQWKVRDVSACDGLQEARQFGEELLVNMSAFKIVELQHAARKMKNGKVA